MSSLHETKRRISSIKNTAQITRAMQMVSASKMKRAEQSARETVPYAEGIYDIVRKISSLDDYKSPYTRKVGEIKNTAIVVIGPGRGFVGGMTTNLLLFASTFITHLKEKNTNFSIAGISIQKLGLDIVQRLNINAKYHFAEYHEHPTTTVLTSIYQTILKSFAQGEFDEVYLAYTHFISTLVQKPVCKRILPISFQRILKEAEQDVEKEKSSNFIFEPNTTEVLDFLLPEYFETQILSAILDSHASEHSARMVTMKNATDNAEELADNLKLEYNRTRQDRITQELMDNTREISEGKAIDADTTKPIIAAQEFMEIAEGAVF